MYKILDNPHIHNFVQKVLSIGRTRSTKIIEQYIVGNCFGTVLDLGCGTLRFSHLFKNRYIGLDINSRYLKNIEQRGKYFVCGDGTMLPFKNNLFDSIFCIGFFHHIDSRNTERIFQEIRHVSNSNTIILVIDAFYPDNKYDCLGYILIKLDRGRYIRTKESFIKELREYFDIVHVSKIDHGYPYYLNVFILKIRDVLNKY